MDLKMRLSIILFVAIIALSPARVSAATVSDLSKQLICQCGCTLVLANCTHTECHSREAMTTLIEQKIAQGQSEEQITQLLVAQYGEQVLASPPKRGFNLLAWVTPFAVILAGGGLIYLSIKRWVRRGKRSQTSAVAEFGEKDEEYLSRLEKELANFTERGFR